MGALGVARSEPGVASEVTAAAVVALHNLHRLLSSPPAAVVNVVTRPAGPTAFARRAGCSRDNLGIVSLACASGSPLRRSRPVESCSRVLAGNAALLPPTGGSSPSAATRRSMT
jgi:hypothetical protein